jgi:hypothetical protein
MIVDKIIWIRLLLVRIPYFTVLMLGLMVGTCVVTNATTIAT